MPTVATEIEINAPRSRVWHALHDKAHWQDWNTFLFDCDRQRSLQAGATVWLSSRPQAGGEELEFPAVVTQVAPPHVLQWRSTGPGWQSRHCFELIDLDRDRTRYRHHQRCSGWLLQLIRPRLPTAEKLGMQRMALELKQYAEGWRSPSRPSHRIVK